MTNAIGVAKAITSSVALLPQMNPKDQAPSQAALAFVPLPPPRQSTHQILLTDKTEPLELGIQLEPILPQGSRKKIPRVSFIVNSSAFPSSEGT